MKKQLAAVLLLFSLTLAACTGTTPPAVTPDGTTPAESTSSQNTPAEGFSLTAGEVEMTPGAVTDVVALLGEPQDRQTAPSCVHEGDDVVYTYDGLEIATSPSASGQYITSITLTSDVYATAEGIFIGSSVTEMIAAYGEAEAKFGRYEYQKGTTTLTFMTDDASTVTAITYAYIG